MFTKPNILSFLVHNEVFNKFYSILYIYPFMQKMTCITYTTVTLRTEYVLLNYKKI